MTVVDEPTTAAWDDLGDDELLRRLTQRGVAIEPARRLVADRDREPMARRLITRTLAS